MKLPDKAYDVLKWISQLLLPALGTLYFALAEIWGFPYGEAFVGTVAAVDTFLGVILGLSNASYKRTIAKGDNGAYIDKVGGNDSNADT